MEPKDDKPFIFHPQVVISILIKGVWEDIWGRLYLGTLWDSIIVIYITNIFIKIWDYDQNT